MQMIETQLLDRLGIGSNVKVWMDLSPAELYEHSLRRGEAELVVSGALVAETGQHTGRSPKDKFVVVEPATEKDVWWAGNQKISPDSFHRLLDKMGDFCAGHEVYVQNLYACADPARRLKVQVITEMAWHSLFAQNLFIRPSAEERRHFKPDFTVMSLPSVTADPKADGTKSETFVVLSFAKRMVLIGGTRYAGEIKKSIFTVLNYLMPKAGVMPMHCSANYSKGNRDSALFFGLSGTGKTTLSSDPTRTLIGDDEHGWSDDGIFNFEGGCYAKTIRISKDAEPEIYAATNRFGTVLENVVFDSDTRIPDFDADDKTENTRSAYPITYIPSVDVSGRAGHPTQVLFLSADAFGVLPPVSRLEGEQLKYFFLCGYTAKVAGTERGVTEPEPTFSTCFAAPFLVLPPDSYADMLLERVARHGTRVWMLNTGWIGGAYGSGERISIAYTRAIVRAIVEGRLDTVSTHADPVFGLGIPDEVPEVPTRILDPRAAWSDPAAYDRQAARLKGMFEDYFRTFRDQGAAAG
ncbi:MAG TPA: phosphoenolpyruvate carboxykinase (ATP) [Candidatus Dormibacteraeota bacterium]|nr:phosphoenolpyruvate carboxykinase (ATP) [Candidatus Dormibacteraeota bacterium]